VSVLLRQPHGFEGFSAVEELPEPYRLSVADSPDMGHRRLYLGVAFPPSPPKTQKDDDLVAPIEAFFDVDREVFKQLGGVLPVPPHRLAPAINRSVRDLGRIMRLDLWVHQLNYCVEVSASERLVTASSQIDVFLRHRPRSMPQGDGRQKPSSGLLV
jgi:hypothetical protein